MPNTIIGCNDSISLSCNCLINCIPSNIAKMHLFDILKAEIKDGLLNDTQIKDIRKLENGEYIARFLCEELSDKLNCKYQLIAIDLELELNSNNLENEGCCIINQLVNSKDITVFKMFEQIFLKSLSNWRVLFPIIFNRSKYQKIVNLQNSLSSFGKIIKKFADMSDNINHQLDQLNKDESLLDKLNAIVMNSSNNGLALEYDILILSANIINGSNKQIDAIVTQKEEKDLFFSSSSDSDYFLDD
ncbi:hypothetical protein CONCODRAFT_165359 [Conidiobolus coronatus NRRL 28638]|uniref:Uncharacterized protein n=1 Tax=Conidiobolus coronatus (strain ATCC 28846 / CBS 209.66 / NRRL 28638) TaxID=796925 RepID=A0A137PGN7_CONC2|nr:hypothetical protein CONCODRAFT_165359 [Conidiobolus coronatus NRRL 28638]|eukprot:KXN74152.1 hypothetical protein CONCODRAFT_165359 [Conidiobolus coronatus NRRL 28638]